MLENDLTLSAMAEALAKSTNYRVFRRLVPRETFKLGMVKFDYLPDGRIAGLRDQALKSASAGP